MEVTRDQEGVRTDDPDLQLTFLRTVTFGSGGFKRNGKVERETCQELSGSSESGKERLQGPGHL